MSIERFSSGGPWEKAVGYSRAVRAGNLVFVAGCTGVGEDGEVVPGGAYEQAAQACRNVAAALELAGAGVADVVQTRMYVTDIAQWEAVGRAHAEVFGAAPPVSAMVQVSGFISPAMVVEIEATAFVV
ncbi:MAG: RidA family protein [Solirubrobacteraceae bacterium]